MPFSWAGPAVFAAQAGATWHAPCGLCVPIGHRQFCAPDTSRTLVRDPAYVTLRANVFRQLMTPFRSPPVAPPSIDSVPADVPQTQEHTVDGTVSLVGSVLIERTLPRGQCAVPPTWSPRSGSRPRPSRTPKARHLNESLSTQRGIPMLGKIRAPAGWQPCTSRVTNRYCVAWRSRSNTPIRTA